MKKILAIAFITLLLPVGGQAKEKKAEQQAPRPSLVATTEIQKGMVNPLQLFVGTIYYDESSKVASATEGLVTEVNVDDGDLVEEGALLVTLDREKLEANIAADKAQLNGTFSDLEREQKNLKRYKELLKQKSISQTKYDETYYLVEKLSQQTKTLKAQIRAKEIEWEEKGIKAPFGGIVVERSAQKGEWVAKGNVIATMVNPKVIEAVFHVPSRFLNQVKLGETVTVTVDNKPYEGTVDALIPSGDLVTRTFPLKVKIINEEGIPEGVLCSIELRAVEQREAMLVPRDAVIKRFGQNVIFLNNQGVAQMAPVKVVGYNGTEVAIEAAGVKPGMMVVVKGNERIFPNMPLQELPKVKPTTNNMKQKQEQKLELQLDPESEAEAKQESEAEQEPKPE